MQSHTIKRVHKNKSRRIVGRGGKHAKTSGRGTKGQNARAGHKKRPEIRDFIKRLPKLRGRGKNINTSVWTKPFALNMGAISKAFKAGETVTLATLQEKGLVSAAYTKTMKVKILGGGTIDKKLTFQGFTLSASAKAAIEKAGGTVA